ncbi:hypothetical protein AVEN_84021-1, partial [Araneus ventricosus]
MLLINSSSIRLSFVSIPEEGKNITTISGLHLGAGAASGSRRAPDCFLSGMGREEAKGDETCNGKESHFVSFSLRRLSGRLRGCAVQRGACVFAIETVE